MVRIERKGMYGQTIMLGAKNKFLEEQYNLQIILITSKILLFVHVYLNAEIYNTANIILLMPSIKLINCIMLFR